MSETTEILESRDSKAKRGKPTKQKKASKRDSANYYKCCAKYCKFKSKCKEEFDDHKKSVFTYICPYCDHFESHFKYQMKTHLWYHENSGKCETCSHISSSRDDFLFHSLLHKPLLHCTECSFTTKIESELQNHVSTAHIKAASITTHFECPCGFTTTDYVFLRKHKTQDRFCCLQYENEPKVEPVKEEKVKIIKQEPINVEELQIMEKIMYGNK